MKTACERKLEDLISVGPAIRRDFALLGIKSVADEEFQRDDEGKDNRVVRRKAFSNPC